MLGELAELRTFGSKCREGLRRAACVLAACRCARPEPAYPEGNITNDPVI